MLKRKIEPTNNTLALIICKSISGILNSKNKCLIDSHLLYSNTRLKKLHKKDDVFFYN